MHRGQRLLPSPPHLGPGTCPALGQRGLGREARPFSVWRREERGEKRGSWGTPTPPRQGPQALPPPVLGGATGRSVQGPEMPFLRSGTVTSQGPRTRPLSGGRGGGWRRGGPMRTKGPQDGGLPALDLGSPPPSISSGSQPSPGKGLARGQGRARRGAAGLGAYRGPPGGGARKKPRGLLPGNGHSESPAPAGPGSWGGSDSLHASRPPKQKLHGCRAEAPTPWLTRRLASPPSSPTRAQRGRGAVTGGRKERAVPARPDAGRSAAPPPAPRPPPPAPLRQLAH